MRLSNSLSSSQKDLDDLARDKLNLKEENQRLIDMSNELNSRMTRLNAELEHTRREKEEKYTSFTQLSTDYVIVSNKFITSLNESGTIKSKFSGCDSLLNERSSRVNELKHENEMLKSRVQLSTSFEYELKWLKEKNAELIKANQVFKGENDGLTIKNSELNNSVAEITELRKNASFRIYEFTISNFSTYGWIFVSIFILVSAVPFIRVVSA